MSRKKDEVDVQSNESKSPIKLRNKMNRCIKRVALLS